MQNYSAKTLKSDVLGWLRSPDYRQVSQPKDLPASVHHYLSTIPAAPTPDAFALRMGNLILALALLEKHDKALREAGIQFDGQSAVFGTPADNAVISTIYTLAIEPGCGDIEPAELVKLAKDKLAAIAKGKNAE